MNLYISTKHSNEAHNPLLRVAAVSGSCYFLSNPNTIRCNNHAYEFLSEPNTITANVLGLCAVGILKTELSAYHISPIVALTFN